MSDKVFWSGIYVMLVVFVVVYLYVISRLLFL